MYHLVLMDKNSNDNIQGVLPISKLVMSNAAK